MGVPEPAPQSGRAPADPFASSASLKMPSYLRRSGKSRRKSACARRCVPWPRSRKPFRSAHLLVAGETVEYYDLHAEAEALGMGGASHVRRIPGRRGDRRLPGGIGCLPVHAVADITRNLGIVAAMSGRRKADDLDRPGAYGRCADAGSAQLVCVGGRRSGERSETGRRQHRHSRRRSFAEAGHAPAGDG